MRKFHYKILSKEQKELLPFLWKFKSDFILCWWTAISLLLWHRKSIDFDLFYTKWALPINSIINTENKYFKNKHVLVDLETQRDILVDWVKLTYISYPFKIDDNLINWKYIKTPDIITLWAMKAYSIGRRAKWKDYVDLYFIINKYWLELIIDNAKKIFKLDFSEKMFIRQLWYFDDIDYSEKVYFTKWYKISETDVKKFLQDVSLNYIL